MLQALELTGFKSFADRTRFEFPRGITVVVGPNGSGKSNVVDAVKWVLGSQSVKALRGKERSDVIFSGAGERRPAGSAEVSLLFDNAGGLMDGPIEMGHGEPSPGDGVVQENRAAEQVQISRRLYRSGEAEYLVNRQPCRLRDVRDVLAGAGMSTGAYSIIEQGKVDAMLQSSPRDRRAIFEEAAGISRFKTKREEAARRLERVQQNLLRLTDIVDELQSRLTRVRSQAGRARKYKDAASRLQELRTQASVADWRELTAQLTALQRQFALQQQETSELEQRVAQCDAEIAEQDRVADELQARSRAATSAESEVRERIAQCETRRQSQQARIDELRDEAQRLAHQLLMMTSRAGDSKELVKETAAEFNAAEAKHAELVATVAEGESKLAAAEASLATTQAAKQAAREELEHLQREAAQLENESQLLTAKLQTAKVDGDRRSAEIAELQQSRRRLTDQHVEARQALEAATESSAAAAEQLKGCQEQVRTARQRLTNLQKQQADLQGRLSGARERTVVLEELQRRLEGLNAGTKEALRRAREEPAGPFGAVRGVVADLLQVDADSAGLVEIALGDRANYLVVLDAGRIEAALLDETAALPGRVTMLRLDVPAPASAVDRVDLSNESGIIGRAEHFVEAAPELGPMLKRLLGRYWFVDTLETALKLASGVGRGLNFVTVAGEVVAADGTLSVGPRQSTAGLLSRRSELRALREQVHQLGAEIAASRASSEQLENDIPAAEASAQELSDQHARLAEQTSEAKLLEAAVFDRLQQVEQSLSNLQADGDQSELRNASHRSRLAECRNRFTACDASAGDLKSKIKQHEADAEALALEVEQWREAATDARVSLAGSEQRRDGLQRQMAQLERDHEERDRALAETRQRAEECVEARASLARSNEQLREETTQLATRRMSLADELAEIQAQQDQVGARRSEAATAGDAIRQQYFRRQQTAQQLQMQMQQFEHQRSAVCERMHADYKVELAELVADRPVEPIQDRSQLDVEVRQLQNDLEAAGPVNLEAVEELDALEQRHRQLADQHDDLQTARTRLEQIVGQINIESRQLFTQTIDEVRGHFRELFTNLFGGGEADIIVQNEQGTDLLECGIEIVARPPGKQPRSISLLSGGERTLTCVALLLGIFKSRPSPVCILDEVDAALDEANIDRFVEVLKEFMGSTQFIVITHSKRTMSCSDTIYGVTMQEAGVSKRVSVRFEDVTHDGRIKPAALARESVRRAA